MSMQFYLAGLVIFSLFMMSACQTQDSGPAGLPGSTLPTASIAPGPSPQPSASLAGITEIPTFIMRLEERFRVQAVAESHQEILKEVIGQFQSDLSKQETEDYYQSPGFSIKLLAGSEGSYFHTAETLALVTSLLEGYAQALVIYPDQSFDVFKGQLSNGAFYFSGATTLPENNTTYLVALNTDLETQVLSGNLEPFQLQSLVEASASPNSEPTPSPTVTPTPTPLPSASVLNFDLMPPIVLAEFLERERVRRAAFAEAANQQRPAPPPPPQMTSGRFPPPDQAPPRPPDGSPPGPGNGNPPPPPADGNPPPPEGAPPPRPVGDHSPPPPTDLRSVQSTQVMIDSSRSRSRAL